MFRVIHTFFPGKLKELALLSASALLIVALAPVAAHAQKSRAAADDDPPDEAPPAFSDFKGVRLGMPAEEARKKLGTPRDKGAEQDFYVFNDTEAVQVSYDKKGSVSGISIDFMSGASGVPSCKDVMGTNIEPKADGSMYKMVRYPKAGYWISYSRTAGNPPTVTITLQKIEH